MKKIIKNKGITLITLSITVIILSILAGTLIYNASNIVDANAQENMHSDIATLKSKIATFYSDSGILPIKEQYEYTNDAVLYGDGEEQIREISRAADTGKFYVIDLSMIENLTLNFGKDYQILKEEYENKASDGNYSEEDKKEFLEQVNSKEDIYIINEKSHNIFYVAGINVAGEQRHAEFLSIEKDVVEVEIQYIEGVPIDDEYIYVKGSWSGNNLIVKNREDHSMKYRAYISENDGVTSIVYELI